MNNTNGELLESVGAGILQQALNQAATGPIDGDLQKQVVEITDRLLKMDQIDNDFCQHREKLEFEKTKQQAEQKLREQELEARRKELELREQELEAKRKDQKWNWGIEIGKVVIISILMPTISGALDRGFKMGFAKICMDWENTGKTFSSEPGRAIRGIFNFK